jgi:uncharacterized protein YhaN
MATDGSYPEAFTDTIAEVERFFQADRRARDDGGRVAGIDRENEKFRDHVITFVKTSAPDLATLAKTSPDAAVSELMKRLTATQKVRDQYEQRLAILEREHKSLASATAKRDKAETITKVIGDKYTINLEDLAPTVARSKETLAFREQFARDREDVEVGTGLTLDQCDEEYAGRNRSQIDVALSQAIDREKELRDERDEKVALRNKLNSQLADMDASEAAVAAEAELLAIGAQIDRDARRWTALSVARHILDQQAKEYVEKHQGPLLEKSGQYLARLTCGAYTRLRVASKEGADPLIEVVDQNGRGNEVDALSDGTRDQLYLALRLAALDEYFKANEVQPLILDDSFVNFDDDRTVLAFDALAEFSKQTQVLYFTHHRGCVNAAKLAVPPGLLAIHDLGPRWTTPAAVNE